MADTFLKAKIAKPFHKAYKLMYMLSIQNFSKPVKVLHLNTAKFTGLAR